MAPESRNKPSNPLQRLLETEEKGRGLALFGWAGVTVFAFLAAFASWQFSPARAVSHLARMDDVNPGNAGDITGGIKPAVRPGNARVPTVPTPLPGDSSISRDDVEQLRADLKDLRRMVGRIDVSTDVLARRISNLEDSVGSSQVSSSKPPQKSLQALAPITPIVPASPAGPAVSPTPAPAPAAPVAAIVPAAPPTNATSPITGPVAPAPAAPPQPIAGTQPSASVVPQPAPQSTSATAQPSSPPPRPPTPADQQAEKSTFDRNAVDRTSLERMLLQRAQGLESDGNTEGSTYIPPLPDPVSVVPKTRPPLVLPPQPLPIQPPGQPMAKTEPKPLPDAPTTGSVAPRVVMPIDPTKAVVVPPPVTPDTAKMMAPKPDGPKPDTSATEMSPEDQKKASEKMALAMREEQTAAARPAEPMGIDLGGYRSIGQVKKVWSDLELRQGKLAKALTPLARLGEATDGVEIRLVVGPFLDKEQALRTCRQLRGATAKCDTVAYAGEPILTKPAPDVEHRPAPSPEFVKRPPLKLDLPKQPVPPTDPTAPKP